MNSKRKMIVLLAIISMLTATLVFAAVLYTLNIPATWNVRTSQGLVLENATTLAPITSLGFTVDQYGSETQSFVLKNTGNHAVNVTAVLPADLPGVYQWTTTFANNTIAQGGSYGPFTITLTDFGMTDATNYNGNFAFEIVTGFSAGSSSFGATTVQYGSDTAQYFSYISGNFNASSYPLGSTVLYSFTTKNINQTYSIQGISYSLSLVNSTGALVSTPASGLLVAYYQDATHYGAFGNGTHMTDQPLMPNQTMTIWTAFTLPNYVDNFHLVLSYDGHNAFPVPGESITWTSSGTSSRPECAIVYAGPTILGATQVGQPGNVTFTVENIMGSGYISFDYTVVVKNSTGSIIQTIASGSNPHLGGYNSPPIFAYYNFAFTVTAQGGSLTMVVTLSNIIEH